MKTYRNHRCTRRHKTTKTFLECAIPRSPWITGTGDYALIAWCHVPTITLWAEPEEALEELDYLNDRICGGNCTGNHEVVWVDLGGRQ